MSNIIRVKKAEVSQRQNKRLASTLRSEEYSRSIRELRKPSLANSFYQQQGVMQ